MYSKTTEKLGLPQWEQGNHPEFINDMNPAFQKIDEAYGGIAEVGSELPKQVKELQTLTQSQQEDITQLRADLSDAEVKIINLEGNVGAVEALTRRVDLVEANNRVLTERVNNQISRVGSFYILEKTITLSSEAAPDIHPTLTKFQRHAYGLTIDIGALDGMTKRGDAYLEFQATEEDAESVIEALNLKVDEMLGITSIMMCPLLSSNGIHGFVYTGLNVEAKRLVLAYTSTGLLADNARVPHSVNSIINWK